jgi:adenylate cyclase class IV
MIEVEIRGELSKEKFDELNQKFASEGKILETQEREMILLRDTPRYSDDPTLREVDIRIRKTNGDTEIMVKEMKSENNVARSEKQYKLGQISLEEAKEFVGFFGSHKGQWMHRKKKVYDFLGAHWSLTEAVPGIYYYELEHEVDEGTDLENTKQELEKIASSLDLPIFTTEEYKDFIKTLGEKVNKYIEW